jgi:hypothetical protein
MTEGEIRTANSRNAFSTRDPLASPSTRLIRNRLFLWKTLFETGLPCGNRGKVSKALQVQALKTGTSTETWHPSCSHREAELMRCGLIRVFKLKSAFKHTPELRKIYLVFCEKLTVRGSQDVWTL